MKILNKILASLILLSCTIFASNAQVSELSPQTITFTLTPSIKIFGDEIFTLSATASSRLTVQYFSSDTKIVSINGTSVSINGAGIVSITAYQTGNETYSSASETQILTVNKASQNIYFEALANRTLGSSSFVLHASASTNLPILFSASSPLVSINNDTLTMRGVGTVTITADQIGNNNYLQASVTQILTILPPISYKDRDNDGLIEISYIEQLDSIRYNLYGICNSSICNGYELTRNLDFKDPSSYGSGSVNISYTTGSGWDPIGNTSVGSFNAIFEGGNNYINNLYINKPTINYLGLFGRTDANSHIRNIGIRNVSVSGNNLVGGLVGLNNGGMINQSYATGSVLGSFNTSIYNNIGGLVGWNRSSGRINGSYATVSVSGYSNIGGLVGLNDVGTISQSHATGYVSGSDGVGGLVGDNYKGEIVQSYATGSVSGSQRVGGLVGYSDGNINQSYATGYVSADSIVGGLVGYNYEGTITQSYATAPVLSSEYVGGLVGYSYNGFISQSYATGSVSGYSVIGGLVGYHYYGTITQSYATGYISSSEYVGGLVGYNYNGFINQSYATGSVLGSVYTVGGLVGHNDGDISQSYTTGYVSGNRFVGGLVGANFRTINQSYATGSVSGNFSVGGLVGYNKATVIHGYWNKDASQIVNGTERSNKLGIGINNNDTKVSYVRGLTLYALQNPTGTTADSVRELGPGFIYKKGFLPAIHKGARIAVNNINFTQTVPSITNIQVTTNTTNVIHGDTTTRTILTLDGIDFTANFIDTTSGRLQTIYTMTIIQNGTGMGIVGKYQTQAGITFTPIESKTFGDTPFMLEATSSDNAPVLFFASNRVSIRNNIVTIRTAGIVNIIARSENDSIVRFANQIFTIHKADRDVSFEALANKTFGDAPFVLEGSALEGLTVSYSASNTLISISNDTVTIRGAGTVNITAYLDNDNFFGFTTQILTIDKRMQSISFDPLANRSIKDVSFLLHATSSARLSVLYSSASPLISVYYNIVRMNEVGTVNITAYNNGSNNYLGTSITQTFTIYHPDSFTKTTLTFTAIPNLAIGQSHILAATSNSPVAITFITSDTRIATVNGSTLTAVAIGTAVITASQARNPQFNPATTQQTVTVVSMLIHTLTPIEKKNAAIRIYPNPANDYITIQTDKAQKISSIKIYDLIGVNYELKIMNYELSLRVDLRTLLKGEYIIIVYGEKREIVKSEKIIIK
ncbi:MAG: GLUG motif-containing protein [Chitinophagaceae bacterium]|nr:GLUG motif-containing protein [Chitinophagaceae bacterium]